MSFVFFPFILVKHPLFIFLSHWVTSTCFCPFHILALLSAITGKSAQWHFPVTWAPLLPLIAPSCCSVSLTTSVEKKSSGQGLSSPLLKHARVEQRLTASPGLSAAMALPSPYGNATLTLPFWHRLVSQWGKEVPGVAWGSCPVLHCKRLCWASPSDASCLCKVRDVEEWKTVGELCSAPLWASDRTEQGRRFVVLALQSGIAT